MTIIVQFSDKMLHSIKHRGPDHCGTFHEKELWLGHQRLSIIDTGEQSHQPFEKDGLVLVFNGEIYNYIELKKELASQGTSFQTNSDTEVLLESYRLKGKKCLDDFRGCGLLLSMTKGLKDCFALEIGSELNPLLPGDLLKGSSLPQK